MKIKTRTLTKYIPVKNKAVLQTGELFWRLFTGAYTFCVSGVNYDDMQLYKKVRYKKQYKVKFTVK